MKKLTFDIMSALHKEYVIAFIGAIAISLALIVPVGAEVAEYTKSKEVIALEVEALRNHTKAHGELPEIGERSYIIGQEVMPVTAYNSVPWQTDDTPCIGAEGTDICKIYESGENVCAANFVALGTELHVEGLGTCIVRDRMNKRYHKRVDWYMGMDIAGARQLGIQHKQIAIYAN